MYIKEVIIDGFKSYAKRTVISGFDPSFNAITGLNGSGKSNILDSICFVLGISNLSQVRASNLKELIYKSGQANVSTATVSIVFDNSNRDQSPIGYEEYEEITVTREISIGGKNKYYINGKVSQLARVQNLFHSVQLNVNNPHFLIMQGRITKVLNMKPPEILSMIEEAAGTRMFQSKKEASLKTIAKKQLKVDEINKILAEEITPQLEKLRQDAKTYKEWSDLNANIQRLERYCVAFMYHQAENMLAGQGNESLTEELKTNEDACSCVDLEIQRIADEIQRIIDEKSALIEGSLRQLESDASLSSKELVKSSAVLENLKETESSERKKLTEYQNSLKSLEISIRSLESAIKTIEKKMSSIDGEYQSLNEEQSRIAGQRLGINMGSHESNSGGSIMDQIMQAEKHLTEADAAEILSTQEIDYLMPEIKAKEQELKLLSRESNVFAEKKSEICNEIDRLTSELNGLALHNVNEDQLRRHIKKLKEARLELLEPIDQLKASLSHVCFDYDGPGKSGVIGKIVSLFKLKSDKLVTAIEICAGNRLFNLVVDSVRTAETVLQNKHFLQHRVTMIPLDKISPKVAQANTVSFAKKIGGSENVHIAIDLLDFDGSVRKAMEFVFGNTFICTSAEAAHSVCFHDKIRTRAVTLDGDSYDPSGTLNGGFRGKSESLLSKVLKMHSLHGKLDQVNSDLNQALAELQDFERVCSNRNKIEKTLEISRCKLDQYEKSVEHSRFREIEKELALLKEKLEAARFSKTSACQTKKEAQKRLEELSKIKSGKIDHSCILAGLKDKIEAKSLELQRVKSEYEGEKTRLQDMLSEEQELIRSISELSQSTRSLESQVQEATAAVETITRRCRDCEKDLQKLKDSVVANDSETNDLKKRRMALQKKKNDLLMEGRKIQHKLARYHREFGECAEQVKSLSRQFPWINDVKDRFGVKNTEFDFSRLDFEAAQKSLQDSKSKIEKLSKKVNKKVQVLIERSEADFKNLMERRSIIEGDKVKIEQVIEELERKKNETMETTWKKVNSDFGSIFSTLLPGTTAMLQPPEGQTVLDGLEVKVAFGNVWKESLSELSGGQRSLLALSLILALLRFKPAPMYILDEVDAALDLSHTQNIGRMLKKHFSQSQFIVVSLKEGMFSNANVVFRTKFVDGVSTVARTVNRQ